MKRKVIGYWAATAVLVFALLSGGAAELARRRENVEGLVHLGYPLYFVTIIGLWKVLGGIALLVPRFPRLKEWAYAGIFFNMTGAAASHAVCGDAAWRDPRLRCTRGCFVGSPAAKPYPRSPVSRQDDPGCGFQPRQGGWISKPLISLLKTMTPSSALVELLFCVGDKCLG